MRVAGNLIGFGWMCGGLGVAVLTLGVNALFGWIPVQSAWDSIAIVGVGVLLLGIGGAGLMTAAIAQALADRSRSRSDDG